MEAAVCKQTWEVKVKYTISKESNKVANLAKFSKDENPKMPCSVG